MKITIANTFIVAIFILLLFLVIIYILNCGLSLLLPLSLSEIMYSNFIRTHENFMSCVHYQP